MLIWAMTSSNSASLSVVPPPVRRLRGAQPSNRNARKHGFYARQLDSVATIELYHVVATESLDPAAAIIRIKLRQLLTIAPGNQRPLREAAKLLTRCYAAQFQLDKTDTRLLKEIIWRVLQTCAVNLSQLDAKQLK